MFLGHPAGLGWLSASEFWERFSYYGMQTLLVLYLTHYLLLPGNIEQVWGFDAFRRLIGWVYGTQSQMALASNTAQLYAAPCLCHAAGRRLSRRPGDRPHRTVTAGAILMVVGTFLLVLNATFLLGARVPSGGCGLLQGQHREPGGRSLCDRRSTPRRWVPDLFPRHPARGDHLALHLRHAGSEGRLASGLRRRRRRHGAGTGDLSLRAAHLSARARPQNRRPRRNGRRSRRATGKW